MAHDDGRRRMPVREFQEQGYLLEVNRRFLHPLGLALEIIGEDDGTAYFGGVLDARDDPAGFVFAALDARDRACMAAMDAVIEARIPGRLAALGYWIQE